MDNAGSMLVKKRPLWLVAGTLITWSAAVAIVPGAQVPAAPTPVVNRPAAAPLDGPAAQALVDRYCVTCHNDRIKTAGLSLSAANPGNAPAQAEVWEKVIRKVSAGSMPPVGMPRPDQAALDGLTGFLAASLDKAAAERPDPGRPVLHRLNRAEYGNAVRDLLALEVPVTALLPPDELSHGFDNIGEALGISPVLLERYLAAADRISALAVGDPSITAATETYPARGDSQQLEHIEGLPLGTRGGVMVKRHFPLDGDYVISAKLWRTNNGFTRGLSAPHVVEFSIDGERVFSATVGGQEDWTKLLSNPASADAFDARLQTQVPIRAGMHTLGVTFVEKTGARNMALYRPLLGNTDSVDSDGVPRIDVVMVSGPFKATGPGETASRARLFTCRPQRADDERRCASSIVSTLARRAFRRPVPAAELTGLMAFYDAGRKQGNFERGVQMAVRRVLADPAFLFRAERERPGLAAGRPYRVSDIELASRLSFFLWSSIPDDTLLTLAEQGKLSSATVYRDQVRRMLADPKADALISNFSGQWLQLRNLERVAPNPMEFPDFDDDLRQAFRRETELFFGSIVREDRSVLDLLKADYTFVNGRLARHYGMPGVNGSQFRRVTVTQDARKGILGQGSILTLTSHPNRTSPVKRGKWVLENLLGSPPPPPPANVPPLKEGAELPQPKTMKERMAEHRANPTCANCHRLMDPIGLAMENFDGVGAWRVRDAGARIDATSQLSDGTAVDGVVALRDTLVRRPEVFVRTMTENLLVYALGRGLTTADQPTVRAIMREAQPGNYRVSALVTGIVNSTPFRMRMAASTRETE
jgi:mono/diheme cytochrome c family protein